MSFRTQTQYNLFHSENVIGLANMLKLTNQKMEFVVCPFENELNVVMQPKGNDPVLTKVPKSKLIFMDITQLPICIFKIALPQNLQEWDSVHQVSGITSVSVSHFEL